MSNISVAVIALVALVGLIICQVPIAFAMVIVGVAAFTWLIGWTSAATILASEPAAQLTSIDLSTLPLFILMGTLTHIAGFSDDIYRAIAVLFGHRRGGLAYATIGGCAIFGSLCGSSTATAAAFSKISLPQMLRRGYSPAFSLGTIAAGGTLKSLIPPSLAMILYCVISKTFIFDLFIAAVIPALLTITLNLLAIWLVVFWQPEVAPLSSRVSHDEVVSALRQAIPACLMFCVVFCGFYSGVFTLNEAASVAVIVALLSAAIRKKLTWRAFADGLEATALVTAMLYMIVIGATVLSYSFAVARVPETVVESLSGLNGPLTIVLLLVVYLILGAIFDEIAALVITLPIVLPLIVKLGYDPIWWGVINVVILELGMIIPPIGLIVFVLHGINPQFSLSLIYRGVMPFIVADIVVLGLLTAFPGLSLWLLRALS